MKSYGLLTYFDYYNYGSMLQGYATQQVLQSLIGQDNICELIDYHYISPIDKSKWKRIVLRFSHLVDYLSRFREIKIKRQFSNRMKMRNVHFDEFKKNFTRVSQYAYHNKRELSDNIPDYDVYVIGSDQTWSPKVSGGYEQTSMLLDYVDKSKIKCSYAPSLGTTKISDKDAEILRNSLNDFSILSCREEKGVEILRSILNRDVEKVLDPTLLLTGSEWRRIATYPPLQPQSYILCYFLGDQEYYREFAKRLSEQTGLPLYFIPVSWKDCNESNNLIFDAGPREFIGWIDNAYAILTDSFHGVAFSTNLNKDFYSFVKHKGGISSGDNSRLYDFLKLYNLDSRLIENYSDGYINFESVNYKHINELLDEHRMSSLAVLNKIAHIRE